MKPEELTRGSALVSTALYALLFTFFLQLLSDFIESIYAFGLLGTSLPLEMVAVLLIFSPVLLLFFKESLPGWSLLVLLWFVLVCRVVEVPLDTFPKMLVSGFGVAGFLIFFPTLLWRLGLQGNKAESACLGAGLALATLTLIAFRALYAGVDVSTTLLFQVIGWILAVFGAVMSVLWYRQLRVPNTAAIRVDSGKPSSSAVFSKATFLSLGIMSVFLLLYFAFANPHVIARWTAVAYPALLFALLASISLVAVLLSRLGFRRKITPRWLWGWNLVFLSALVMTILSHQIYFPNNPGAYPLYAPHVPAFHLVFLLLSIVLSPVILVDFILFTAELIGLQPPIWSLGGAFSISCGYLLLMLLAHIFTTVYDYIPVVGPFFRDKFWLVHLVVGVFLLLPLLLVNKQRDGIMAVPFNRRSSQVLLSYLILVSLVSIGGAMVWAAQPASPVAGKRSLKIMTYNIQQGYSADGLKNTQGQLDLIRSLDPDLVGLQESDTNRISGGNTDIVRFFADNLDMHAYYGPKTVTGTFGIALLSKYPLDQPRTFYMYSAGEQTATIRALLNLDGETFHIFVTHLGNDGPIIQQEQVLGQVQAGYKAILMGDFNFEPDTPQYRMTVERLEDAWLLKWPGGVDDRGVEPSERIDHVFLSPGIPVTEARYIFSPASDHPAELVTIEW